MYDCIFFKNMPKYLKIIYGVQTIDKIERKNCRNLMNCILDRNYKRSIMKRVEKDRQKSFSSYYKIATEDALKRGE